MEELYKHAGNLGDGLGRGAKRAGLSLDLARLNEVRRRFSEFEWLLNALTARFCGLLLPSLPEKKLNNQVMGRLHRAMSRPI